MKSEGSRHVYINYKTPIGRVVEGKNVRRVMNEVGNIKGLEVDNVKNYILIPTRVKDKDGKEYTSCWHVHEIHTDCEVKFKPNVDEDRWV